MHTHGTMFECKSFASFFEKKGIPIPGSFLEVPKGTLSQVSSVRRSPNFGAVVFVPLNQFSFFIKQDE
jgi:hypothetical protein